MSSHINPPDVYIELKDGTLRPLTRLSPNNWGGLDHTAIGIPVYINTKRYQVWPKPDDEYPLFILSYFGTVGKPHE